MGTEDKIVLMDEMVAIRQRLAEQGKRVVFTNGVFDILHRGHAEYLAAAQQLGDVLILGLNGDDSVRRLKGEARPLVPVEDRAYLLASLAAVDYVVVFDSDTPRDLIAALKPDILVKGGDYRPEDIVGRDTVEADGGSVVTIPLTPQRSTTNIIQKIMTLTRQGRLS